MDCQTAYITDDESSVGTPEKTHTDPKEVIRPVTLDMEQMREEIFKDQEQETILHDEDETVEEDYSTFTRFTGMYALALKTKPS